DVGLVGERQEHVAARRDDDGERAERELVATAAPCWAREAHAGGAVMAAAVVGGTVVGGVVVVVVVVAASARRCERKAPTSERDEKRCRSDTSARWAGDRSAACSFVWRSTVGSTPSRP